MYGYVALIISRIHAEFDDILSYIRGRSVPLIAHAIRQDAIPTRAHRLLSGSKHSTGLPANSSSFFVRNKRKHYENAKLLIFLKRSI